MTIEGLDLLSSPETEAGSWPAQNNKERTMASVLNGLKDDLMDVKAWTRAGKAAVAGNVGVALATGINKIPYLKDQSPLVKNVAQGLGGLLLGVLAERFVGDAAAHGFIGGATGHALAKVENNYIQDSAKKGYLELGDLGAALTPEERAFLSGTAVETPLLDSVDMDAQSLTGITVETDDSLSFLG